MAYVHPAVPHTTGVPAAPDEAVEQHRPALMLSWQAGVAAAAALGAILRFAGLGHNSVWFDEAYLLKVAVAPWRDGLRLLRTADFHPPLYYLVMHLWFRIAGLSDAGIRVPSACFGAAMAPLTAVLVRRAASPSAGVLAAFFVAASPFSIMAAQDARMYTLLGALALGSTITLEAAATTGGARRWGMYAAVTALMLYTHYLAWLLVAAHGLAVAWAERRALRSWLYALAGLGAVSLPWLPSLAAQLEHSAAIVGSDAVSLRDLSQLGGLYAFGGSLLGMPSFFFRDTALSAAEQVLLLLPFLAALAAGLWACSRRRRAAAYLAIPLIVPVAAAYVAALLRPPFAARWFSFLVPWFAAILSIGVMAGARAAREHPRRVAAAIAVCLLLYSVPVLMRYYTDPAFRPYNWRAAAAVVRERARPGDVFLYGAYQNELPFTYYFGPTAPESLLLPGMDVSAAARAARVGAARGRIWLIVAPPVTKVMLAETLERLRRAGYVVAGTARTPAIFPSVMLLQAADRRL